MEGKLVGRQDRTRRSGRIALWLLGLVLMRQGKIHLVINTPRSTGGAVLDGNMMRRLAVELNIPFVTTMAGARMEIEAIHEARDGIPEPRLLEIKSL